MESLPRNPTIFFLPAITVDLIRNASPASDNPEAALQEIFSLLSQQSSPQHERRKGNACSGKKISANFVSSLA